MRDHAPAAGFVCAECHAQSFPERQQEYDHLLAGRILRVQTGQFSAYTRAANRAPSDSPTTPHGVSVDAGVTPTVELAARDHAADAPAARAISSPLADAGVAPIVRSVAHTRASSAPSSRIVVSAERRRAPSAAASRVLLRQHVVVEPPAVVAVIPRVSASSNRGRDASGRVRPSARIASPPSSEVASDYVAVLPRRRTSLYARTTTPRRSTPSSPARRTLRPRIALPPLVLAAYHTSPTDDTDIQHAIIEANAQRTTDYYVVSSPKGSRLIHYSAISVDDLWLHRACQAPHWLAVIMQLRSLHDVTDSLMARTVASPPPVSPIHAHVANSAPSAPLPLGTPADVQGKQSWEVPVPKTFSEAMVGPHAPAWQQSMQRELQSLLNRGTWTEGYVPRGIRPIATRWIYNVKASLIFKSRLVARGDQRPITADEPVSESPTVARVSLNTLFAVSTALGWKSRALDVDCAYLYGDIPEDVRDQVWLKLPAGLRSTLPSIPGRTVGLNLHHTLYGLRFSGRQWYLKLHQFLLANGFTSSVSDPCIYYTRIHGKLLVLGVYVDDLALFSESETALDDVTRLLMNRFSMKDLGSVQQYLGLHIRTDDNSLTFHVAPYIQELAAQYLTGVHVPVLTPADSKVRLKASPGPAPTSDEFRTMQQRPYGALVGSLAYIAVVARPDIARIVHSLQRAQANPSQLHWDAAIRVLQYLHTTPQLGPQYHKVSHAQKLQLHAFVDASFAPDWQDADGVSVSGYIIFLAGGPIAWASHKQRHVAGSTCEAKFVALSECMNTLEWLKAFLQELGIGQTTISVYEDNCAAISLATGLTFNVNSRHIVVRYARVREVVAEKLFTVTYVPTREQIADGLTKNLPGPTFLRHLPFIMGQSVDNLNNLRREYLQEYQRFLQNSSNDKIGFEKLFAPQNGGVKTDGAASEERDSNRETQATES